MRETIKRSMAVMALSLILCSCSHQMRGDGWYPVADYPDNSVIGEPLATVAEFDDVALVKDTFCVSGDTVIQLLIEGRVVPDCREAWADGTERLVGHRLGFVYEDSVVTAPRINARIESGNFQINSPDTILIQAIYDSIKLRLRHR